MGKLNITYSADALAAIEAGDRTYAFINRAIKQAAAWETMTEAERAEAQREIAEFERANLKRLARDLILNQGPEGAEWIAAHNEAIGSAEALEYAGIVRDELRAFRAAHGGA